MLFASAHIRVTAEYGTASLWLDFPGEPVNALDVARLRELDAAFAAIELQLCVRNLVVRSAKPSGFCAGIHPNALVSLPTQADRAAFAWVGQRVLDRLARLPFPTVAFMDGPCLGAGLELALACRHRLVLARSTTHLGFPDTVRGIPPCFGGSVRLRELIGRRNAERFQASGRTLSGREAQRFGLVDQAFCERRAKIELRSFLDRLERTSVSREPTASVEMPGFAAERRHFAQARIARQDTTPSLPLTVNPVPTFPRVVGLVGDDDDTARIASEVALRGGEVIIAGDATGVFTGIAVALARGFITPLEAEQARSRVHVSEGIEGFERCGLVLASGYSEQVDGWDDLMSLLHPRCVLATLLRPGVVQSQHHDPDSVAALAAWLTPFGCRVAPIAVHQSMAAAA